MAAFEEQDLLLEFLFIMLQVFTTNRTDNYFSMNNLRRIFSPRFLKVENLSKFHGKKACRTASVNIIRVSI